MAEEKDPWNLRVWAADVRRFEFTWRSSEPAGRQRYEGPDLVDVWSPSIWGDLILRLLRKMPARTPALLSDAGGA
jgi:hypothetical protein